MRCGIRLSDRHRLGGGGQPIDRLQQDVCYQRRWRYVDPQPDRRYGRVQMRTESGNGKGKPGEKKNCRQPERRDRARRWANSNRERTGRDKENSEPSQRRKDTDVRVPAAPAGSVHETQRSERDPQRERGARQRDRRRLLPPGRATRSSRRVMLSCDFSLPSEHTRTAWLSALVLAAVGLWCTRGLPRHRQRNQQHRARSGCCRPGGCWPVRSSRSAVLALAAARAGRDPDVVLPLCALGLLALPYLPWLPDRVPAFSAAAGPARDLFWLVIFWLIRVCVIGGLPGSSETLLPRRPVIFPGERDRLWRGGLAADGYAVISQR